MSSKENIKGLTYTGQKISNTPSKKNIYHTDNKTATSKLNVEHKPLNHLQPHRHVSVNNLPRVVTWWQTASSGR